MQPENELKNSFERWQQFTQTYNDLAVDAAEQTLKQSLAARERWTRVWLDGVAQLQALSAREQETFLQAAQTWQTQAQSATERLTRLYKS